MSTDEMKRIEKTLDQHERRTTALENMAQKKPLALKAVSVKEFILEKRPEGDVKKTLVLGYYLEHHRSTSPFNADDLKKLFREGKEIVPENINDKVNMNIAKGLMMEAGTKKDNKKTWTLTGTGERYVENSLRKEN